MPVCFPKPCQKYRVVDISWSEIVYGRLPLSVDGTVTLSIKVPVAMKQAIASEAKRRGTSTSNYARTLLAEALLAE